MTVFQKIKNMDTDELAEWLDEHGAYDDAPWFRWWDENYCKKCKPVIGKYKDFDREMEFAWCELNDDRCKFFQDMDEMLSNKQIIKMWLESECD